MKQSLITIFLVCAGLVGFSQIACLPTLNGIPAGDEPPGCFLCEKKYAGNMVGFTPDNITYDFPCGEIENSQWFTVAAGKEGELDISINFHNCLKGKGIEVAVYDQQFNIVSACKTTSQINEPIALIVNDLTPFEYYQIMLDGVDGDICDFDLEVKGTEKLAVNTPRNLIKISPTTPLCKSGTFCYSIQPVEGALGYSWSVPSFSSIVSGGDINDIEVCITYERYGIGVVKVIPYNRCEIAMPKTEVINVSPINVNIAKKLCPIEFANHQFRDTCFTTSNGCDSCVFYTIDEVESKSFFVDTTICINECLQVGDSCYSTPGFRNIIFEDALGVGCDSVVQLLMRTFSILPSPIMECKQESGGFAVEWAKSSGATSYDVFINRDSFATVDTNYFFIENVGLGSTIDVKIQPIGSCTYLPAELTCNSSVSNIADDFLNRKIKVFPNPTTGIINIESDLEIEEIEIYDTAGRILQKEKTTSFELENRESGIYFFKLKTNQGVSIKRVLKI